MLPRKFRRLSAFILLLLAGCDAASSSSVTTTAPSPAAKIVSLSPAATDLLLAMGAADRLVGVSNFDSDPRLKGRPRIGDYENVDWERIAMLGPGHMIVQMAPERLPAGFSERAAKHGVALYNAHIDRLDDITREARGLGDALGLKAEAAALVQQIESALTAARARGAGKPRVRTLISVAEDGLGVAGPRTYLDDILSAAGGENVLASSKHGYVKLDREALLALAPEAVIHLAPSPTATQRASIARAWAGLADLPAVRDKRVLTIEDPWALMPGAHVGNLAERISKFLHP